MADVDVTRTIRTDAGFTADVVIAEAGSSTRHTVRLSRRDWEEQGERWSSPEEFVRRCVEYLLEREPKESILAEFDVRDIVRYFPSFERDVLDPGG